MSYLIENNVPLPSAASKEKPPIERMAVGDSVVIEAKSTGSAAIRFSSNALRLPAPFNTYKFKSASLGGGKYRVWRIA